jgi:hypothetical protein
MLNMEKRLQKRQTCLDCVRRNSAKPCKFVYLEQELICYLRVLQVGQALHGSVALDLYSLHFENIAVTDKNFNTTTRFLA